MTDNATGTERERPDIHEPERVTTADVPDGREWQVVEVVKATQRALIYNRVRYGLTRAEATEKADEEPAWVVAPMPEPGESCPHPDGQGGDN
jgi:hypothetical protein